MSSSGDRGAIWDDWATATTCSGWTEDELVLIFEQAPEIQTMYSLGMPVSALRTKMRQEFERHRYVNQIGVVDVLLFQSHAEFQVRFTVLYNSLDPRNVLNAREEGIYTASLGSRSEPLPIEACRPYAGSYGQC
jgi:hypothetical protein